MNRYLLPLLAFIISSGEAYACGTVLQRMQGYPFHLDNLKKEEFLKLEACGNEKYYAPKDTDKVVARVLDDAIESGLNGTVINNVIKTFNCVQAAKSSEPYPKIRRYIEESGLSSYCYGGRSNNLYIVSSDGGVNIRSAPSRNSGKIGAVADGVWVLLLNKEGNWALVESSRGRGYVYYPLLSKY